MEALGEGANRPLALLGLLEVLRRLLGELHPLGGDGSRDGSTEPDEDQEEDGGDGEPPLARQPNRRVGGPC